MSKQVAHTPGPWRVGRGAQADPFSIESETRTLANVKSAYRHLGETEANAHLIAAAPDLLAALNDVCAIWLNTEIEDAQARWQRAEAAIAKAEGRA